jgi:error-prone DNA polymerase
LEGFGSYGFPESHAIAFAHLVYVSCWLKCHYPEVFTAALLNSQPMGFYHPDQIVRNARDHWVKVLPIDINHSHWDNTLEAKQGKYFAMRLGFRQIKGIREEEMSKLISGRLKPYTQPHQLCDAGVTVATLERLANADAFRSIGLDRRQALWEVSALKDRPIGAFEGQPSESELEPQIQLPLMRLSEHVVQDYASTGLTIKPHIVSFIREQLAMLRNITIKQGNESTNGIFIKIAGRVINRQRPGTAKGVCFITLEDETGAANLVVFPKLFDKYRREILSSRILMVEGKVEKTETVHIIVSRCWNVTKLLGSLTDTMGEDLPIMTPVSSDDRSGLFIADDPRGKAKGIEPNEYLHNGRNFR